MCLGEDGGVIAVVAEKVEELIAQFASVVGIALGWWAEFHVIRSIGLANPGGEHGLLFRGCGNSGIDSGDAGCGLCGAACVGVGAVTDGLSNNSGVGIGVDSGGEAEIVTDGSFAVTQLRPLVAQKADALGRDEFGFNG